MISALIGLSIWEKWLIFIGMNMVLSLIEWYSDLNKNLPVFFSLFDQLDLSKKWSQKTLLVLFNGGTTRLCTSMKFINKTFSLMQTTQYCFSCIWIEKANFKQLACRRGKQTIPIKKKNETMIEEELYLFTWMHFDLICFYCMTRALSPW